MSFIDKFKNLWFGIDVFFLVIGDFNIKWNRVLYDMLGFIYFDFNLNGIDDVIFRIWMLMFYWFLELVCLENLF